MICADLFSRFSYEMGKSQYYSPSAPERSENRLFGMFHASTPQHSKDVIMGSLEDCHGTVRVVFASVTMGIYMELIQSSTMVLQAVLKTISKLVVEEGKVGDSAYYIVYRTPKDCQTGDWIAKKNKGTPHW